MEICIIPWKFVKEQLTDTFKITPEEADSLITGLDLLKDGYISPELFVKSEMQNKLNEYIMNAYKMASNDFSFRPVRRSVGKSRKSVRKYSRKAKKSSRKAKKSSRKAKKSSRKAKKSSRKAKKSTRKAKNTRK